MYKNVGKKIMVLAQVFGWLTLVGGIITGIVLMADIDAGIGAVVAGGSVVLFLASWFPYGFGQLVDDVHELKNNERNPK